MPVTVNSASSGIGGGTGSSSSVATNNNTISASGYRLALRSSQAGFGNLQDVSPAGKILNTNARLFPATFVASATVATGTFVTPLTLNGYIYECTTGGGANAATEPTWPTVVGNTVVSGANTYTCRKGPYFIDPVTGVKTARSLLSTGAGGAASWIDPTTTDLWDMSQGQSIIVRMRLRIDWTASGQADGAMIYGTRDTTGIGRGFAIRAYGTAANNSLRFQILDGTNNTLSGIMSASPTPASNRRQLDGTLHEFCWMVDGQSKIGYCFVDGQAIQQTDMTGSEINPNGQNVVAVTGSTAGTLGRAIGSGGTTVTNATTVEVPFTHLDEIVLPGGLPANLTAIAQSFYNKGDPLLPQWMVQQ